MSSYLAATLVLRTRERETTVFAPSTQRITVIWRGTTASAAAHNNELNYGLCIPRRVTWHLSVEPIDHREYLFDSYQDFSHRGIVGAKSLMALTV